MKKFPSNNPYQKAAKNYGAHTLKQPSPRETEASALLRAARMMQDLQIRLENLKSDPSLKDSSNIKDLVEAAVKYNRQIWVLFYDNALCGESSGGSRQPSPSGFKTNVVNLANFVFRKSVEVLADPVADKFNVLININREIASGLMCNQASVQAPSIGLNVVSR